MTNDTTPAPIGAPVPRYKIGYRSDEWGERSSTPGGIPDPAGAWVRYDDHAAALASAAQPGARRWPPVSGIGRDADHSRAVVVYLAAEPTDDEMCALHDAVRGEAAAAPKAAPTTKEAPPQEAQEPVAWRIDSQVVRGRYITFDEHPGLSYPNAQPLYTAPPPAPAPLSDDTERLEWLLWKLPGDALRYVVGELADTSSGSEFRAAIDAAIAAQGGKT